MVVEMVGRFERQPKKTGPEGAEMIGARMVELFERQPKRMGLEKAGMVETSGRQLTPEGLEKAGMAGMAGRFERKPAPTGPERRATAAWAWPLGAGCTGTAGS